MAPYYSNFLEDPTTSFLVPRDDALLSRLRAKNEEELKKLDDQQKDAEENQGETEVNAILRARALYLARIGEKVSGICRRRAARCRGCQGGMARRVADRDPAWLWRYPDEGTRGTQDCNRKGSWPGLQTRSRTCSDPHRSIPWRL